MPYSKWSEVNDSIKGLEPQVTLAQANSIARCADEVEDVESPWAVCLANFRKSHRVEEGKWVKKDSDAEAAQYGELIPLAEFAVDESDVLPVQILRPGTFTEMHGRKVTIEEADFPEYISHFETGTVGQELPVFIGHPQGVEKAKAPAGAWYKRLYTKGAEGMTTLWADIQLTALGKQVLGDGLYKYLSPSVSLASKCITGGGFVNLPSIKGQPAIEMAQFLVPDDDDDTITGRIATVLKALKVLGDYLKPESWAERRFMDQLVGALQAVGWLANSQQEALEEGVREMSEVSTMHLSQEDTMTEKELEALREKIRAEVVAELTQQNQEHAELAESIRAELRPQIEAEFAEKARIQAELAEYVGEVTTGEAGLQTPPDEITAFLASLTPEQLEVAKTILKAKVVDFSERGHTGTSDGLKPLPIEAKAALVGLLKGVEKKAETVAVFAQANSLSLEEYDFSEFLPAG